MPVFVLRENLRGETCAHGLVSKEVSVEQGSCVIRAVVGDPAVMGYTKMVLNSGQEQAMQALQIHVKNQLGGEIVQQLSAKG